AERGRTVRSVLGFSEYYAPGAERLVQPKDSVAAQGDEPPRRTLGVAAGDVEVEGRASQQVVADGPADDPGFLAAEDFRDHVEAKHRRLSARPATGPHRSRRPARTRSSPQRARG